MAETVAVKFKGNLVQEYVTGIPARDLTAAEWEGLTEDQRQTAVRCGLYEVSMVNGQLPMAKKKKRGE